MKLEYQDKDDCRRFNENFGKKIDNNLIPALGYVALGAVCGIVGQSHVDFSNAWDLLTDNFFTDNLAYYTYLKDRLYEPAVGFGAWIGFSTLATYRLLRKVPDSAR
ncbi:MAG: hypothetical protein ABIB79_05120 [archaeon]